MSVNSYGKPVVLFKTIMKYYSNKKKLEVKAIMVDAFSALNTNNSQQLIVQLILLAPKPEYKLLQRFFIHVAGMEMPPHQVFSLHVVLKKIKFILK